MKIIELQIIHTQTITFSCHFTKYELEIFLRKIMLTQVLKV